MAGVVPAMHEFPSTAQDVDGRDKHGHDEAEAAVPLMDGL